MKIEISLKINEDEQTATVSLNRTSTPIQVNILGIEKVKGKPAKVYLRELILSPRDRHNSDFSNSDWIITGDYSSILKRAHTNAVD